MKRQILKFSAVASIALLLTFISGINLQGPTLRDGAPIIVIPPH